MDLRHLPSRPNVVNINTNATGRLAYHGAVFQSRVDTLDGVILHANEEA